MAIIGQELTNPESGWTRYDDSDSRIKYNGTWATDINALYWGGKCKYGTGTIGYIFKFYGSEFRLIGIKGTGYSNNISVNIDGDIETFSELISGSFNKILMYEKSDMSLGIHTVIVTSTSGYISLDAIDIDSTGYLVHPYINGKEVSSLESMEIGDYISYQYDTTATGVVGSFSNLGTASGIEIPVTGVAIPNATNGNKAYFIKTAKGTLVSDRVIQHSVSWDALNASNMIEGLTTATLAKYYVDIDIFTTETYTTGITMYTKISKNYVSLASTIEGTNAFKNFSSSYNGSVAKTKFKIKQIDTGITFALNYQNLTLQKVVSFSITPSSITFGAMRYDGVTIGKEIEVFIDTVNNIGGFSVNSKKFITKDFQISASWMGATFVELSIRVNSATVKKLEFDYFHHISNTVPPLVNGISDALVRSLSGGNSYADYTNKRIVSTLLHGNGIDGSTTFTDSSPNPKVWARNGNAMIKTDQSKFGGSSMYFNGTTDYITSINNSDFDFKNDDFTIEMWINVDALPTSYATLYSKKTNVSTVGTAVVLRNDGKIVLRASSDGISPDIANMTAITPSISIGGWNHIVLVKLGNQIMGFVNGVMGTPIATSLSIFTNTYNSYVGGESNGNYFKGYIDEVRIIKGKAEYTSNFTPPTEPYDEPKNTLEGAISSLTDKGFGAYSEINEWDKYIVNSDLDGKIIKGDDNVWHNNIWNWTKDTPMKNIVAPSGTVVNSNVRTLRGQISNVKWFNYTESTYTNTFGGFRPVLEYLETDSKATTLFY